MLYSLSLENCKQLQKWNRLYWSSLSAMLFFQQILNPISVESICTCNDLGSISRHYSVLYRNSMSEMFFYVFWVYKPLSFVKLIIPSWEITFLWENIFRELTFGKCASKIANFAKVISWIQTRNLMSQKTLCHLISKG